jgi:hypothetical protein
MAPLGPPASFPDADLAGLAGARYRISEAWARGPALIVLGHSECETTRLTLPYVDRLHRGAPPATTVIAVLQDTATDARALVGELGLELPVRLDGDPYPLSSRVGLATVPTLFLVDRGGRIEAVSEAFRRADLEAFASRLQAPPPFGPGDDAPALRPG